MGHCVHLVIVSLLPFSHITFDINELHDQLYLLTYLLTRPVAGLIVGGNNGLPRNQTRLLKSEIQVPCVI